MIRIAAIADVHFHTGSWGALAPLFDCREESTDLLLIGSDLSVTGALPEARVLLRELEGARVPIVAVLGNHDFESHHGAAFVNLRRAQGIVVLEGDEVIYQVRGEAVGLAGARSFCVGVDKCLIAPFGETAIEDFALEGLREVQGPERALSARNGLPGSPGAQRADPPDAGWRIVRALPRPWQLEPGSARRRTRGGLRVPRPRALRLATRLDENRKPSPEPSEVGNRCAGDLDARASRAGGDRASYGGTP